MKKILYFLFVIVSVTTLKSQNNEIQNIATFTKIWGFLKYHHPKVAEGKLDWDSVYMVRVKDISPINNKEEEAAYYSKWINDLGKIETKKNKSIGKSDFTKNYDLSWIDEISNNKLQKELQFIKNHCNKTKNHYVTTVPQVGNTIYDNEKPYKDSIFPSAQLRLLSLARYWNIINYFFPYKYLMDENWNEVLPIMAQKFQSSKDTIGYHLAIAELVAKTNDSHANFASAYTKQYFGAKWVPFKFKVIDNKAIVTGFLNDSLCMLDNIEIGDVFSKVNEDDIAEIIQQKKKYIGASNNAVTLRKMYNVLFNGNTNEVFVTFARNGNISRKSIHRYYFTELKTTLKFGSDEKYGTFKIFKDSIGYVHMGLLMKGSTVEKKLKNCKAIIFDIRNYPNGTLYEISKFLNEESKAFVKFTRPNLLEPGRFIWDKPYHSGDSYRDNYKGLVILLIDENTQSHAEFTAMSLQTAPNVVTMGSQTAGADGNVSKIIFPGNYQCFMTGIGIYYPDGKETQRIGIVPDIEVKPTIQGIKEGRDEVLEAAIKEIGLRLK